MDIKDIIDENKELRNKVLELQQITGQLCDKCGWAMKFPDEDCRCELVQISDEQDLTITKLSDILHKIANTLKGPPGEFSLHSWHDLPELVQNLKNAHVSLSNHFNDTWYECHDGSEDACCKNHDED